jgi:folate-binding protein YgfZ
MFVLRAKARLTDATADYALYGIAGRTFESLAGRLGEPWTQTEHGEASLVQLYPADGCPRGLWVAPASAPPPAGPPLATDLWLWGEARSGVATITAPISEAFVPQMLNYESIGGVNFKKGCYPGQEVVARSQFRGTLKRRAHVAHADAPLAAGQEVFHASDRDQPAGVVAQAAAAPGGGWDAIVSLQTAAAAEGTVTAGSPDGPRLALQPLPYLLLADV